MLKNNKGKEIAVKMNRNFFARLFIVAKSHEIDMKEVHAIIQSWHLPSISCHCIRRFGKDGKAQIVSHSGE